MKIFKFLVVVLVAMCGLNSCSEDCNHDFIEHDYSKDILGTWSIIGPDAAEAVVIKADGTMDFTGVHEGEFFETTARYETVNNRMRLIWNDGFIDEGRLDVVPENTFLMTLDEETGAGYYYTYCREDFSDEILGSWLVQPDEASVIYNYYADGTVDCTAYYYHLKEPTEYFTTASYKIVGDIIFEKVIAGKDTITFGSRLSYTPNGSSFGDVMKNTSFSMQGDELKESVISAVRVNPSLDLVGKKYKYSDCQITCVKGEDMNVQFMDFTYNFANLDVLDLTMVLRPLFFMVDFPDANNFQFSFFNAPIVVEGNKMTVKMSEEVPTFKDVVFYTFQSEDGNQLHLCMDKTAFVNFCTNMHAKFKKFEDEQFDITNAESVNAIYNNINRAVESIKVNFVMTKAAE